MGVEEEDSWSSVRTRSSFEWSVTTLLRKFRESIWITRSWMKFCGRNSSNAFGKLSPASADERLPESARVPIGNLICVVFCACIVFGACSWYVDHGTHSCSIALASTMVSSSPIRCLACRGLTSAVACFVRSSQSFSLALGESSCQTSLNGQKAKNPTERKVHMSSKARLRHQYHLSVRCHRDNPCHRRCELHPTLTAS